MRFSKTYLSLAIFAGLCATATAQANSSVQLYGIIDVGVSVYNNAPDSTGGSKTVAGMNSGAMTPSRWGMRGKEDLGNGLSAIFQIEGGFNPATGASGDTGRLFNRVSMVGLAGDWGQLTFGRQYSASHSMINSIMPLGTIDYEILPYYSVVRSDNSINYRGSFQGLTFGAYYALRPVSDQVNFDENTTGRFGVAASYDLGKEYRFIAGYDRIEHQADFPAAAKVGDVDNFVVGARAQWDQWRVSAVYRLRKTEYAGQPDVKSHLFTIGGQYAFNANTTVGLAYTRDKLSGANSVTLRPVGRVRTSDTWQQFTFMASYTLSKRTNVYLLMAHARNGAVGLGMGADGTSYSLADGKSNQTAGAIGIRHFF